MLDLVPTNSFLDKSEPFDDSERCKNVLTGYLLRLSPSTAQPLLLELQKHSSAKSSSKNLTLTMRKAWRKRYYTLRADNCLYWYKKPTVSIV